ncbi:phosphoribosylglycinamide formyltransferase [Amphibacillus xylanus]|uniref:Phosphoribosylglycinamide formyltransferase n=1 Tax=Amphibacillus xylanus (strain ATCC 51415 / DSM 6626 / JCM 7361 / LMG 17667 / NBRC 15112 / Ep01) TaxID=698758 RepID=K0J055_AMPXN|nr:phosphoribosylglycinamide formyltransferase [Amphibacillus xylanus]BAM46567.1 phosphoribosylglycinamide formyltransferase [Amphibacillus xylanus NBRC 15112]
MSAKTRIAIFASGTGSNYEAIDRAIQAGDLDAEIVLLVCDSPGAKVVAKAKKNQLASFVFDPKTYPNKQAFEIDIVHKLKAYQVEWIVLAGYMRLIGPTLLNQYQRRIINIHPSLLPAFPGLDAVGQALDAGVKVSGVTIHYVDSGMDTGEIIAQEAVPVKPGMTKAELQTLIQKVEHKLYPSTIQQLILPESIRL